MSNPIIKIVGELPSQVSNGDYIVSDFTGNGLVQNHVYAVINKDEGEVVRVSSEDDAPKDNKQYVRKNGGWVELETSNVTQPNLPMMFIPKEVIEQGHGYNKEDNRGILLPNTFGDKEVLLLWLKAYPVEIGVLGNIEVVLDGEHSPNSFITVTFQDGYTVNLIYDAYNNNDPTKTTYHFSTNLDSYEDFPSVFRKQELTYVDLVFHDSLNIPTVAKLFLQYGEYVDVETNYQANFIEYNEWDDYGYKVSESENLSIGRLDLFSILRQNDDGNVSYFILVGFDKYNSDTMSINNIEVVINESVFFADSTMLVQEWGTSVIAFNITEQEYNTLEQGLYDITITLT